jgi:glycosyltransferase involved in cell wall biosynthesis
MIAGYSRIVGLGDKLNCLRPDVVQTTTPIGWNTLQAARYKLKLGYKLFTGNHHHASVFPLAQKPDGLSKERMSCFIKRTVPGRMVGLVTEKCYAITSDCADVAIRFFGVPSQKVEVCPLGVDMDLFNLAFLDSGQQERATLRRHLGFADTDIVCIYTGRFTDDKNPLLLAQAIDELVRRGEPFRGLFVGNGPQVERIKTCRASVIHPFVDVKELPQLFRAADIGVWPAQESMSMLDAAACGLPIVVNHTMSAPERIEGNGLTYRLNDQRDLAAVLLRLRDKSLRTQMGTAGAEKMRSQYSWRAVAERRLQDYEISLRMNPTHGVSTATA